MKHSVQGLPKLHLIFAAAKTTAPEHGTILSVLLLTGLAAYTQRIYGIQKNGWRINNYGGNITVSDLAVTQY